MESILEILAGLSPCSDPDVVGLQTLHDDTAQETELVLRVEFVSLDSLEAHYNLCVVPVQVSSYNIID